MYLQVLYSFCWLHVIDLLIAIDEVVSSLDDPKTAGLILEEQAKSLKNILADPAIQHLIKVLVYRLV